MVLFAICPDARSQRDLPYSGMPMPTLYEIRIRAGLRRSRRMSEGDSPLVSQSMKTCGRSPMAAYRYKKSVFDSCLGPGQV